jgi:hypothetical protein
MNPLGATVQQIRHSLPLAVKQLVQEYPSFSKQRRPMDI